LGLLPASLKTRKKEGALSQNEEKGSGNKYRYRRKKGEVLIKGKGLRDLLREEE